MGAVTQSPMQQAMAAKQQNDYARTAVIGNSIKMRQQIYTETFNPASKTVINVTGNSIRNVGLLLGFLVVVSGNVTCAHAHGATRTPFGVANIVKQFRFDDMSNYTRIQTPGWHLAFLNTVRQGFGYGGVYANNLPMGYGVNYDVFDGPSAIALDGTADLKMQYFVPIAYSSTDLRGAMWMASVSATSNLQIEIAAQPGLTAGNPIDYAYTAGDVTWTNNVTVTVYQIYLDQVPRVNGNPILPMMDINTVYDIKQTTFTGVTQGQDFPMAYSNFRSFLSTTVVYDNAGVPANNDVNYWALQSANFTNIFKIKPDYAALDARATLMTDPPLGSYLFESRDIPINTINYGNQELVINASSANAGARVLVGYEAFANISQLVNASSLAAG